MTAGMLDRLSRRIYAAPAHRRAELAPVFAQEFKDAPQADCATAIAASDLLMQCGVSYCPGCHEFYIPVRGFMAIRFCHRCGHRP